MYLNYMRKIISYVAASLIVLIIGCGGGDSNPQSDESSLRVFLTDAPTGEFKAVNVTINRVRVHQSGSASESDAGWVDITLNPPRKINLLNLTNGVLEELGQTILPAGHYTQLRLELAANSDMKIANSVVLTSDPATEIPLDTPSSVQSGIKLINEFDVQPGQHVDLVLDFDALKSVVQRGNGGYLLKPVIKVVPTELNGIKGFVETALLGDEVRVSAQTNGNVICSTMPNPQTGEFFLARLMPGIYDVVITAKGRATAVIAGVPVASTTSTTVVSTDVNRIALPVSTTKNLSGTVILNPPSATTVAYVAAKQAFEGGPTVTVASKAVDSVSGRYLLTLPVDAPLLGQYGAGTLPIVLSIKSAMAGKYIVEASAEGYKTQQVSREVSMDLVQDFILVP